MLYNQIADTLETYQHEIYKTQQAILLPLQYFPPIGNPMWRIWLWCQIWPSSKWSPTLPVFLFVFHSDIYTLTEYTIKGVDIMVRISEWLLNSSSYLFNRWNTGVWKPSVQHIWVYPRHGGYSQAAENHQEIATRPHVLYCVVYANHRRPGENLAPTTKYAVKLLWYFCS